MGLHQNFVRRLASPRFFEAILKVKLLDED
jgi:hypothetical protein